jgi:plasmid stabilization system protein ParE
VSSAQCEPKLINLIILIKKKLNLTPRMGHARAEIARNVRSVPVGSHIAYYLPRKSGITVLRLLHPRIGCD